MILVKLKHCTVHYDPGVFVNTVFNDGSEAGAHAHYTPHYYVIAHRLGYADDVWRYCFEHEVAHSIVAEFFSDSPSLVLHAMAHGKQPEHYAAIQEECVSQLVQRYARCNEEPIISNVAWHELRSEFLNAVDFK